MPEPVLFRTGPFRGLNQTENPGSLRPGDLTTALNVTMTGDMTGTRPGVVRPGSGEDYESAIDEGNEIQGMYEHRENFDTGRHLIAVSDNTDGKNISYEDDARLTTGPTITAGQDNIWTFTSHENLTWGAGGGNGDQLWHWDGVVGNAPIAIDLKDSINVTLEPLYVKSWRGYMLVNGLRDGVLPDNNPMVTRYCTFATDPTVVANWHVGNTIGFSTTRTGISSFGKVYSTGFGEYQDNKGSWLLLLNNNGIVGVKLNANGDFAVQDGISNGCVGQRSFVSLGLDAGDAVWMSEHGIHSLRQSQEFGTRSSKFLSWKIRPFFRTLNQSRLKFTVGAYDFTTGRIVWAVSTGSNSAHDTLLVLDIKENEDLSAENASWSFWKAQNQDGSRMFINELLMARDESGDHHLYAGSTTGDVVRFDSSVFSDLGSSYSVDIVTYDNAHGSFLTNKQLGDVMVLLQPGGNYNPTLKFRFDHGERISTARSLDMAGGTGSLVGVGRVGTAVAGTESSTRVEKVYGAGSGRTIGFELSHNGANEPVQFGGIDYELSVTGGDAGSAA